MLIVVFEHVPKILKDIQGIIQTLCRLSDLLYKYQNDLIGVEYLTFLHDSQNDEFACLLCTKFRKGSLQSIIDHCKSKPHYISFLQKHFPNVFASLEKMKKEVKPSEDEYCSLLKNLTKEIIYRSPKEHPVAMSINDAISCKIEVTRDIFEASNCKEKATDTLCIDLIGKIEKFGKRIQLERQKSLNDEREAAVVRHEMPVSSNYCQRETSAVSKPTTINDDSSDGEIFDEIQSKIEEAKLPDYEAQRQTTAKFNTISRSGSRESNTSRLINFKSYSKRKSVSKESSSSRLINVKSNSKRRSKSRESSEKRLITKYTHQYENAFKRIKSDYKRYKIVPDSHPKYDIEWKYYWIRKVKLNPAIDYNTSKFIEDWKRFFEFRLSQLELEDNLKARIRIKQKLGLPVDPVDSNILDKALSRESEDKKMAENFDYEELIRKNSPKRKREAEINLNEIEEEVHSKMTTRDQLSIIKQKINKPNFLPHTVLHTPITEIPKDISTGTPKTSKDDNNNEIFILNNQSNIVEETAANEVEKILIMKDQELKILFMCYDELEDEVKSQLTAYMEELKNRDPVKYEEIINEKLEVRVEASNSKSNENKISTSDDDDDDDEELMRNFAKIAEALPKPLGEECINLSETDTEFVDMTVSD